MAKITEKDLDLMAGYTFSINKAYGGYMLVKREISTGGQSELTITERYNQRKKMAEEAAKIGTVIPCYIL